MLKILIVEGNSREIIQANRDAGRDIASDRYRYALNLHTEAAQFDISFPFAPEMELPLLDYSEYDGIALTGSGVSWSSYDERSAPYMQVLEKIVMTEKPIVGSCWGMQTVVQLFGGHCEPNTLGTEVGLAENITLNKRGENHWFFRSLPSIFSSPCIHRDHVTRLSDDFELLASNKVSEVQAVASVRPELDFVGVQFHPELELEYVHEIYKRRKMASNKSDVIASFPEVPSEMVTSPYRRTLVLANWLEHVVKKKTAAINAAA